MADRRNNPRAVDQKSCKNLTTSQSVIFSPYALSSSIIAWPCSRIAADKLTVNDTVDRIPHFQFLCDSKVPSFKTKIAPAEVHVARALLLVSSRAVVRHNKHLAMSRRRLLKPAGVVLS